MFPGKKKNRTSEAALLNLSFSRAACLPFAIILLCGRVETNSINPVSQGKVTGQKPCIHAGLSRFDGYSHSVMILPTGFFDFTQESNDYYFPPLVGTYLRVLRVTVFLLSLFITPAWYLMVSEPNRLPGWLNFLSSPEPVSLSLLSQLLVVEFLIDVLKLASLNTPDSLSNSFSMLGALVLGDFAVQAGWLGPEVLVYMAFVSVAGFAQPSYELGYAFKLLRVALLLVTAVFDVWGFCLGVVGIFVLLCTTKPLVGKGYLYPLVPFNGKALLRLLVREPISRDNT